MMKIRTALLTVAAVFAALSATAEPFNEGGVHYVYEAPAGSYKAQEPAATAQPYNARGQGYVTGAPAGSNKPDAYAGSQSEGLRDSHASGGSQYSATVGRNN
jgi:hypothetical protein